MIAAGHQLGPALVALMDDAEFRLVPRLGDGAVEERLVMHDAARLQPAGGRQDGLGLGVVDARRQLVGGKAAEHHRMDGAQARAGQHGDGGFGDHRHVDDHPVALAHALVAQHRGEGGDVVEQLGIGVAALLAGHGAVIDERGLVRARARDHMAVEAVEAGVAQSAGEPVAVLALARIEDPGRRLHPVDVFGGRRPETGRVALPALIDLVIAACRGVLSHRLSFLPPLPQTLRKSRRKH